MKISNYPVMKLSEIRLHPQNPRQHTDDQIKKIANSIKELGWGRPLILSRDNFILAGHGAYLAARDILGYTEAPIKNMNHSHDAPEALAYMVADNKLTEESDWNYAKLEALNENLQLEGFDTTLTAFDTDLKTPNFQPVNEEKQPRLDKLDPKGLKCPECGYEW
ncbi:ParB/Srx family N-terminal domain-containing protein [Methanobacterium ferruginis]|uniref:ParB/Srx family N-terminal domain-containing protein n=1 Tax=Methanobacterium ferruginis TaxID=710191 RepID=UPI0025731626|nr:ParB/Srx family N-terminal domain-containing protein [Methanobacterium ferruginis]BDZ68580.1 hypothetical protein GCM10025860_20280 [Methanobacterium ferruginis]